MKNKIPRGWTDYLPYGDKVEGTKIFPFKTPLKLELQYNIPKTQWFTPACLLVNRPKLRAVIDLTDTDARADRYYCPKDFVDADVEHLKMRISGGGWVPGLDKIKEFSDAIDGFLKKYEDDPDALIGVHCTHGLNRTGYFVCMYMVTRMNCNPVEAIDRFQEARGYKMYRQNFLEEIMEPGKHSGTNQKLNYARESNSSKTIVRLGNYSYENNWLEGKPRKPSRGFQESEKRNSAGRNGNGVRINEARRRDRRKPLGRPDVEGSEEIPPIPTECSWRKRRPPFSGDRNMAGPVPCAPDGFLPSRNEVYPFPGESNLAGLPTKGPTDIAYGYRPKSSFRGGRNMKRPVPFGRDPVVDFAPSPVPMGPIPFGMDQIPPLRGGREELLPPGGPAIPPRPSERNFRGQRREGGWRGRGGNWNGRGRGRREEHFGKNEDSSRNEFGYRSPLDDVEPEQRRYGGYRGMRRGTRGDRRT